ncbi:MAG: peptidoglycan editing factor PgeF [Gammaproteobacteria bacterium]|nr:peptidoglycan editing factor PgeF [Gammaproteobacteria bacterium]MCP5423700.1 peptidoglycan editing factor PgeF [Gammaproteobacteria bacterium]
MRSLIRPDWPAPARVRAASTTRLGGVSQAPYDSLNLGDHVGDQAADVAANRRLLGQWLDLPGEPAWLRQVHGKQVIAAEAVRPDTAADAVYTGRPGPVCVVQTADCLPVLLCDEAGTWVAAVHCGWRGLALEILPATLERAPSRTARIMAWLGPAIGPDVFEVGDEVRATFVALRADYAACFRPSPAGRWLADIYGLARLQLRSAGVLAVYGGTHCTVTEVEPFFSYRRDGRTGRMASLIWLAS